MSALIQNVNLVNPFPGLRPFQEGEEHYFFGRENQTDALIDKLYQTRFLAVIGSSGSGKSSLVNCGLLSALRGGQMARVGTTWKIVQCRPSGQAVRSLASALAEPGALFDKFDSNALNLSDIIDSSLHMSERGIVDVFELSRQKDDVNLLIVVDQFEELFRYKASQMQGANPSQTTRSEAAEFIKLLLHAHTQSDKPIYIVLTMRSDFLGDCTRFHGLAEAINQGQYLVPRMSREERRLAISGPVAVGGAQIDPVLLTRLVNDLGDDPDQLSILQHALNRIWARWAGLGRTDEPLNLAHYSSIGSMRHALDHHAEKAYAELSTQRQQLHCEKLFKALTNKATDRRGVRRPSTLSTLCELTGATADELTAIIDVFRKPSRSFLMPSISQALEADTVIDISHESFMRIWKRLIAWADEEAESSNIFRRLSNTAQLHANAQAGLWRDPDLQLALEWRMRTEPNERWASRIGLGFSQAMTFLDESRVASDNERADALRRDGQERELERSKAITEEQQKRLKAQAIAANRQRQIIGLITAGLIVTTGMMWYALDQKQFARQQETEASDQKTIADSQRIIAERQTAIAEEEKQYAQEQQLIALQQTALADEKRALAEKQQLIAEEQTALARQETAFADRQASLAIDQTEFAITQTRIAEEQSRYKELLRSKLVSTLKDQNIIFAQFAALVPLRTPVVRTFTNQSTSDMAISTIDSQGKESISISIPPGQSIDVDAFINQIWIARKDSSLAGIYDAGAFNTREATVYLESGYK